MNTIAELFAQRYIVCNKTATHAVCTRWCPDTYMKTNSGSLELHRDNIRSVTFSNQYNVYHIPPCLVPLLNHMLAFPCIRYQKDPHEITVNRLQNQTWDVFCLFIEKTLLFTAWRIATTLVKEERSSKVEYFGISVDINQSSPRLIGGHFIEAMFRYLNCNERFRILIPIALTFSQGPNWTWVCNRIC